MALIGITTDYEAAGEFPSRIEGEGRYLLRENYALAINNAGGTPVILPILKTAQAAQVIARLDGLLVTGGAFDIPPELSGISDPSKARKVRPERTEYELALVESAFEKNIPVLGICGGMQLIAVASGGNLIGDIVSERPESFDHEQKIPPNDFRHPVRVVQGSLLFRLAMKEKLGVNSTHHQAVAEPGCCVVGAWAPDGIIEAVERPDKYWVVGVQWHPELLADKHEGHAAILRGFVRACEDRNRPCD